MNGPLPELRDQAHGKWPSILAALGIGASFLRNSHGPCPICGGTDRYRFDDRKGNGEWFCNVCRAGDGVDLLMKVHGWDFAQMAERVRGVLGEATISKPLKREVDPAAARQACLSLWTGGALLFDDDAARYLRSRGFSAPFPQALRFHPAAEVSDHPTRRTLPALLARVSTAERSVNIHRTYLENGAKAQWTARGETVDAACRRLMPGELPVDAAIRLFPHDGILGVAEGIETAMAVTRDFGIPCWSLINSTHMARWKVPADVRELHIFGDNDPKFGGQAAAWTLAHRTACRPNPPIVFQPRIPDATGTDWADAPARLEAA